MNRNKYLLDTCFVLALLKQEESALLQMEEIDIQSCFISFINRIELLSYQNTTPEDEEEILWFISQINILPMTAEIENRTIDIRKRHKIKLPDAVVLATVLEHHLTLLTLDEHLLKKYQAES